MDPLYIDTAPLYSCHQIQLECVDGCPRPVTNVVFSKSDADKDWWPAGLCGYPVTLEGAGARLTVLGRSDMIADPAGLLYEIWLGLSTPAIVIGASQCLCDPTTVVAGRSSSPRWDIEELGKMVVAPSR